MENSNDKSFGSFLDWTVSEVVEWLQSLSLNGNYQCHFEENQIDGKSLLKFNQTLLQDQLKVADTNDRVTILQTITAMRADLMTNSSDKNAIIKMPRPSSAGSSRPRNTNISLSNMRQNSMPTGDSGVSGHRKSTRHHSLLMEPKVRNLRRHRSLDRLIESDSEENSLNGFMSSRKLSSGSSSSRLVNILKEENSSLKKELDSYYQRVRRLHKIEQEVEQIRESHQLLEESTKRRERLENAMRAKLEHQLKKLKESNFQLEMELQTMRNNTPQSVISEMTDNKVKREIARRDSMIKRLIKQNKDSVSVREKLQKDLQSTKSALEDIKKEEEVNAATNHERTESSESPAGEQGTQLAEVYAKSIENLKIVLTEMQAMSEKKEKIENKLRIQLMQELTTLKQHKYANGDPQMDASAVAGANEKVAALEITIARLEHKCLQVVAERQMVLDAATVPRDTAIARMKRTIAEQQDTIEELKQQKMNYMVQLYDANKKIADLENKKAILQLNVAEKDSLIQTLQQSYAEVDDDLWASHGGEMSPTMKALSPSPTVMGIPSPRSPNHKAGSHDRLYSSTLVGDVSEGTTRLVSSMGSLNGDCSSPTGKTKLGALNLAVATSISDTSPPGQSKQISSSVPNSPGVTHRLLHTTQNPTKTVKSQSAESAWIFSGMQREPVDQKTTKSSPSHKIHSPNRRMLKSFSADRHSPLAGTSWYRI
ncbi:angiomotin-like isoform X2 [Dysidea avara]|uniref:angiomotin-like isoform X2 n=1 Tax=Dysidea avara TaxID=196820 RepID=UPI003320E6E1